MILVKAIPVSALLAVVTLAGCMSAPPQSQENLCAIFDQYPEWYDAAKEYARN